MIDINIGINIKQVMIKTTSVTVGIVATLLISLAMLQIPQQKALACNGYDGSDYGGGCGAGGYPYYPQTQYQPYNTWGGSGGGGGGGSSSSWYQYAYGGTNYYYPSSCSCSQWGWHPAAYYPTQLPYGWTWWQWGQGGSYIYPIPMPGYGHHGFGPESAGYTEGGPFNQGYYAGAGVPYGGYNSDPQQQQSYYGSNGNGYGSGFGGSTTSVSSLLLSALAHFAVS